METCLFFTVTEYYWSIDVSQHIRCNACINYNVGLMLTSSFGAFVTKRCCIHLFIRLYLSTNSFDWLSHYRPQKV